MKKTEEESAKVILLDLTSEMAEPRKTKSVREWEVKLAAARVMRSKRGKTKL